MQKIRVLWLCVGLLWSSLSLAAPPQPIGTPAATEKAAGQEPFDLTEIERLLRASLTPNRMIALVEQYGVSFKLTDNTEEELRRLGASDRLLLVIAKTRVQLTPGITAQPLSPPPAAPAAPAALTWVDPATGLMWAKDSNISNITWNQANGYCANLHLVGYANWRLATIEELAGIYDAAETVDNCHVKGGIRLHGLCWSWSSSKGIDSGEAWGLGFISGQQSSIPFDGGRYDTRVLCVRPSGK